MLLRPFLNDAGSCASYLFGCTSHGKLAVVDAHAVWVPETEIRVISGRVCGVATSCRARASSLSELDATRRAVRDAAGRPR
jgi:hypothetical protein